MAAVMDRELENAPNLLRVIERALNRISSTKEKDLCKFIPVNGWSMHHFTFTKMKKINPRDLEQLLEKHVLQAQQPQIVPSKPRASKTSNTSSGKLNVKLNRGQAKELLELARKSNNQELIELLAPCETLKDIQKELIQSIKEKTADQGLWDSYLQALEKEASESS